MQPWFKNIFLLVFVLILTSDFAFAQKTPAKKDTAKLYENIESYSRRSKFTKFVYRLIFRPVATTSNKKEVKKKTPKKLIQEPYSVFEGKIIRHINIVTLAPFGSSIADTIAERRNILIKTGNMFHIKSQHITIRNLLLIRQNQLYDSLLVIESERLVRSQGYVRDVSFYTVATSKNSDSVDIYIRELDNWSITGSLSLSKSQVVIKLNDENFLGLGHNFKNTYNWYHTTGKGAYSTNYYIPNIRNTYISSTLHYGTDEFSNFTKTIAIDRPLFSPFAKWAGGINLSQQFRTDSIPLSDSVKMLQRFKYNTQDYWVGNAMQIFKGNSENNRTTNFISTLRFLRTHYLERPIEIYDTLHSYSNENFYLAGIGISTRKYVQEKYVFKYGVAEDVPIGKAYGLTNGYQIRNNIGRFYLSARISFGNFHPWGYLSTNFEYGTFFRASHAEQGVFNAGANYFTGLFDPARAGGTWKFRQFLKAQVTIGLNSLPGENLSINDGYGINGFSSTDMIGTNRLLLKMQTQSYAPWNILGFRFGPYFIYSLGMLSDAASGIINSKVYSQIGLGVLIKNDYLVLNTFQFSISFYPIIPGKGKDIFKMNSIKTGDFGFRDFEIGKPSTLVFQ